MARGAGGGGGAGAVTTLRFTLPLPPNRANARWHWREEARLRAQWLTTARFAVSASGIKLLRKPMERATVRATFYLWSKQDQDNLVARLKWPLDALTQKHWGFIKDDSPDVLRFGWMPEQRIDRKNQRLELELTEGWMAWVEGGGLSGTR